jgi:homoserine O-acetyltransferase
MPRFLTILLSVLATLLLAPAASAVSATMPLVEKRVFTLPSYTTVTGETIPDVRLGYETYGTLNERGDNAIFIAHFYSGTSHAAGRYAPDDPLAGYWDSIIGPGKAIDTDKYFVVSADTFANLNAPDPKVVTTGPASIDPRTGKHYGMRFPVVSLRDSVRAHKALLDQLGVRRLTAVAGASGGAIQAMEWAALYPDFVQRVVHVIGPGFEVHPWTIALVDTWTTPIRMDPAWNNGDYYGGSGPRVGISKSLKILTLTARHWRWASETFNYAHSVRLPNPDKTINGQFQIVDAFDIVGDMRASAIDANNMIYMSRAASLYRLTDAEIDGIKAKLLFVPADSDLIFPEEFSRQAAERFSRAGGRADIFVLKGSGGHLDGLFQIVQASDKIREFIESP